MKACNCTNKNWHLVCDSCGGNLPSCLDCTDTERQLKEARAEVKSLKDDKHTNLKEILQLRHDVTEARAENAALVAEFQRMADEPPTLEEIAADLDNIEMLEKELADARAEIDALRMGKMSPCDYYTSKESEENLCRELAEARAEIERLKAPALNASLLREKLAELAHDQWAGWMEYLFFKSKQVDGCVVIPAWANERWRRQVATRYADLSEEEKDSDRSEADRVLAVFNAQLAERDKLIEQMREALEYDRIALLIMAEQKLINPDGITLKTNKAALSAAERDEKENDTV